MFATLKWLREKEHRHTYTYTYTNTMIEREAKYGKMLTINLPEQRICENF